MKAFEFVFMGVFAFSFLWLADYIEEGGVRNLALPIYFYSSSVIMVWTFSQVHKTSTKMAGALTTLYILSATASLVFYMLQLEINYWVQIIFIGLASLYIRACRPWSKEPRNVIGGGNP